MEDLNQKPKYQKYLWIFVVILILLALFAIMANYLINVGL